MPVDPNRIIWVGQTGTANMGDVTDDESVCRFSLPESARWVLVAIRGKFTGGTGTADCAIKLDRNIVSGFFDYTLFTVNGVGSTKPLHFRVPDDKIDRWTFDGGANSDEIVLEWTNPDSGNMRWAVEVGLASA